MPFEAGKIFTYVGTGDSGYSGDGGQHGEAVCNEPFMCDFDSAGNLFFTEAKNHIVRRVDKVSGVVTTVAGNGELGYSGDGGPAIQATMKEPYSLQVDGNGDIYIVDRLNAVIRKVDAATGIITTVAGNSVMIAAPNGSSTAGFGTTNFNSFSKSASRRASICKSNWPPVASGTKASGIRTLPDGSI